MIHVGRDWAPTGLCPPSRTRPWSHAAERRSERHLQVMRPQGPWLLPGLCQVTPCHRTLWGAFADTAWPAEALGQAPGRLTTALQAVQRPRRGVITMRKPCSNRVSTPAAGVVPVAQGTPACWQIARIC